MSRPPLDSGAAVGLIGFFSCACRRARIYLRRRGNFVRAPRQGLPSVSSGSSGAAYRSLNAAIDDRPAASGGRGPVVRVGGIRR